ncbi:MULTISPECIES: large conductance mechanosensitive channel protein MscL [Bacillaceae]|uniref:Large-conductance mechanosensitive channel n=1 Tax=Evansella alkalicola TaxID=745819 RepID=A0ABS6JNE7_9BACI|nr:MULTISPECIES: large conductance mechanosensitive channel protein MscL [Bacillaceae]MBU9719950.1 large conductance mechanosensitive channel protein MscL [Bacillus alkalicola]
MSFFQGFKEFAIRGNVVDMGIGIIIGAAFGNIVTSFVSDVLMPPIGLLLGKVNFSSLYINLSGGNYASLKEAQEAGAATINYGLFIETVIHFIIIAFAAYLVILQMVKLRKAPMESTKVKNCPYCFSDIPSRAVRCPKCTSDVNVEEKVQQRREDMLVRINAKNAK